MPVGTVAIASVLLSVGAQFMLKAGMAHPSVQSSLAETTWTTVLISIARRPEIAGGLVLYVLSAAVWLYVLARWEVSKAYPLVGVGFVLSAIVGYLLGESVTAQRAAGAALIAVGVVMISRT
jgi:multidrug transporter EmrE-like cation transporter